MAEMARVREISPTVPFLRWGVSPFCNFALSPFCNFALSPFCKLFVPFLQRPLGSVPFLQFTAGSASRPRHLGRPRPMEVRGGGADQAALISALH